MTELWYDDKFKGRRHQQVFDTLEALRDQQGERLRWLEFYRLLYSDEPSNGYSSGVAGSISRARSDTNRLSENLVRAVVDAVCAKIGKNSPKPFVVSNGGDGALRRKGKGLNKFLLGKLDYLKASNKLRTILRDAAIVGTGAGKLMVDHATSDAAFERVPVHQLYVDEAEARWGTPSQLFQVTPCSKELFEKLYPKQANQIRRASPPNYVTYNVRRKEPILGDEIEVIEAWHLAQTSDEKGRHVIACSTCTLLDEDWDDEDFPFVFLNFNEPVSGFWGTGLAQLLMPQQFNVNYTLLQIQENLRLGSRPTWLVSQTSNVSPNQIRNVAGNILTYKQTPPQLVTFQTTQPEVFQWLQDQRERAFNMAGISQMSAEGKRPTADLSGIALETMNDVESERFVMFGKAYEQASVDLAEKLIELTRREYEKGDPEVQQGMFKAFYSRSWELSQVKWSQVSMKRDQFNLGVFPISSLPSSISGRQQKIQDLMQQGIIDSDTGRELLDFPDYQRWADLQQASKDNAERLVEAVLYDSEDLVVEKYHNVAYMLTYCQNLYNQQQLIDGDEEKLERLRQLIDQCQELIEQASAAQQAGAPEATPAGAAVAPTPPQGPTQ